MSYLLDNRHRVTGLCIEILCRMYVKSVVDSIVRGISYKVYLIATKVSNTLLSALGADPIKSKEIDGGNPLLRKVAVSKRLSLMCMCIFIALILPSCSLHFVASAASFIQRILQMVL